MNDLALSRHRCRSPSPRLVHRLCFWHRHYFWNTVELECCQRRPFLLWHPARYKQTQKKSIYFTSSSFASSFTSFYILLMLLNIQIRHEMLLSCVQFKATRQQTEKQNLQFSFSCSKNQLIWLHRLSVYIHVVQVTWLVVEPVFACWYLELTWICARNLKIS